MLVNVTEGTLRGEKLTNKLTAEDYYSFKGIPFAKPPVGALRFKAPEPPEKYEGVWDATQERSMPMHIDYFDTSFVGGDEDCLYLNVFTPQLPGKGESLKAVMIYVLGGMFRKGCKDTNAYGPDFLVAKDVVIVIPNYRLHIFGLLNLGIEECRGNATTRDVLAAVKWTKQNIRQFGGDPNNITLFGHSSGAILIRHLMYSPIARGLFHKVILQSVPRDITHSAQTSIERVSRAAQKLGFKSRNIEELYHFLMEVPAVDLTRHTYDVLTQEEKDSLEPASFMPTFEVAGPISERINTGFLNEFMEQDPGVPIMNGVCSIEAAFYLQDLIKEGRPAIDFVSRVENSIVPFLFKDLIKDDEVEKKVIDKFKQFYLSGSTEEEIILGSINLWSDALVIRTYRNFNKLLLKHSSQPLYNYLYSYRGHRGQLMYRFNYNKPAIFKGAPHSDELGYLWFQPMYSLNGDKLTLEGSDGKVIDHVTTLWTNFAKYGNPGEGLPIDFRPVTSTDKSYLEINEELTIRQGSVFEERMKFIDDIYTLLGSK